MEFDNKRVVLGIAVVAAFFALVYFTPQLITMTNPTVCTINGVCQHEERLALIEGLLPFMLLASFVMGAIALFVLYRPKIPERIVESIDVSPALSLLDKDERAIVERVVREGGKALQSELSYIEGIGKVKAHRIIERLERRGVLEKESHGKTNLVRVNAKLAKLLVKKE